MAIDNMTTFTETAPDGSEVTFDVTTEKIDEEALAEEIVDALFDEGIEAEVINQSDLDNDGTTDAVGLDTDKDGKVDMVAGDMDGDGKIDSLAADTDGDGQLDAIASDTDGDGVVDAIGQDTDGDGKLDTLSADLDGDGEIDAVGYDTDGDGKVDQVEIDTDGDGELDSLLTDSDGDGELDAEESLDSFSFDAEVEEGLPTEDELSTNSVEFTVGADGFPITDDVNQDEFEVENSYNANADPYINSSETTPSNNEIETSATEASADELAAAEQQANADAARDAQTAADEYVAQGDYTAAADARAVAEDAAWQAGDQTMLGASDVNDLENAAYKQELAEEYRVQQAEHIAEGDYEAAKQDALNAGYEISDADYLAGGSDHSGQADQDAHNLGNAVSEEKNAEYFADNAEWYAENGNVDAAERSAQNAEEYQASADNYADQADPTSIGYDHEPSSVVETGGTYDAGGYDMAAVDTGFDAGVDTTTTSYDTGLDDTTV